MNNLLICKGKSRNSCSFLAFLLFTFLLVAPTAAQTLKENNITLRVQNEPVENVFNKISEQTNFKFIYDQETVNLKLVCSLILLKTFSTGSFCTRSVMLFSFNV